MKNKESGKTMLLTAGFMAFATFLSKALGLVRDSMMGAYFGIGIEADAFMAASKLPTTLFDMVIGGVISASFIPIFNGILTRDGEKKARVYTDKFITMIVLVTLIISALGILFAEPLVEFMAPNFGIATHTLAVELTSIMFPMIIFTGIAFSFVGILQSYGEYNIPAIISLVSNVAIILYFAIFGKRFGVYGLSVTMIIAWSLQVIVQIPSLIKIKFRYKPDFRLGDRNIRDTIVLAIPMLISTWVQPLYTLVNARFASHIEGAYSSLEYANRLYLIMTGVFSFVVTNLIFPKLAKANADNDRTRANELVTMSLKAVIMVITPLMAGVVVLAKPITNIIYNYGALSEDTTLIATTLACYAAGMVFLAINEVLSKTFFSMKKSLAPMITSLISMAFNVVLVISIYDIIKGDVTKLTGGLALAAAGGSAVNAILNGGVLIKKFPEIIKRNDVVAIIKILIASAVMAVAVSLIYSFFGTFRGVGGNILTVAVCGLSGVVIYALMLVGLRVREFTGLIRKNK